MTNIQNVRSTFLHFLADNLPDLEVWNVRRQSELTGGTASAAQSQIKMNAVNVTFTNMNPRTKVANVTARIEVVYDDELNAVSALEQVSTILQASGMTALNDYTSTPPTATGRSIFWSVNSLDFRPVADQLAYRQGSSLVIYFNNELFPNLVQLAT